MNIEDLGVRDPLIFPPAGIIPPDCVWLVQVKARMLPYCTADTTAELAASLSVAQLLERNYCPPWWVASQQVAGSCRAK